MESIVISSQKLGRRLTAEHFLSKSLKFIEQVDKGNYPVKPISAIGSVRGGKRLPPNSNYVSEGIPYVRNTDVKELRVDFSQVVYISPEHQKIIQRYPLEFQDIVIGIAGTIGVVGLVDEKFEKCQFNENLARITQLNGVNPFYLTVYLASTFGQAYIDYLVGGAVQPKLSLENINRIKVPLPPRPIQDRIAAVMQDAYAQRRGKLAAAEELLGGIEAYVLAQLGIDLSGIQGQRTVLKPISSIAGGRFDFEAVVATQNLNFNGIEATTLRKLGKRITERITPAVDIPDEEVNYISLGNISPMIGTLAEFSPVKGSSVLSSSTKFKKGDILFGRMRPYLNKVWMAEFEGLCTNEAVVLRPNPKKVDTTFLHALLLSQITLQQVVPLQSGTSLPRVSPSDILNVQLPIPDDLKLQKKLGQEIACRRTQAAQLRQEAETVVNEAKARVERMILGEETA